MKIVKSVCTSFSNLCGRTAFLCRLFSPAQTNRIKIKSSNLLEFSRNYPGKDSKMLQSSRVWSPDYDESRLGRNHYFNGTVRGFLNLKSRVNHLFEHLVESKNLKNRIMNLWINFIKERFPRLSLVVL